MGKYLFYTLALSALLAPFAMQAQDLKSELRLAHAALHPGWVRGDGQVRPDTMAGEQNRLVRRMAVRRWAVRNAVERLDQNGDRKIDPAEFQALRRDRFGQIDQDGDGAIALDELTRYRSQLVEKRLETRFADVDGDGDGKVTQEELQQHRFARLDLDRDGYLSPRELFQARAPRPQVTPESAR
jgi:hypothetical protein